MPFIDKSTLTCPATNAFPVRKWLDQTRAPTSADYKNFQIFDLWIWEGQSAWIMIDKTATSGLWIQLGMAGTGILTLTSDVGGAVSADGASNINLLTGSHLTGTGVPASNTITLTLDNDIASTYPTDSGTATPSGGQLNIVGSGGTITSGSSNTVTITSGPTIPTQFDTDAGSATPALNILQVLGGTSIDTAGAGNTISINAGADIATTYTCDGGSATPAANNINVIGSGSTTTSGAGSTITIHSSGGGLAWFEITVVGPTAMAIDSGYFANSASTVLLTLPLTSPKGSTIKVIQKGIGAFSIQQNAGQTIHFNSVSTTTGASGSLTSTSRYSVLELICITTDTDWIVSSASGSQDFNLG